MNFLKRRISEYKNALTLRNKSITIQDIIKILIIIIVYLIYNRYYLPPSFFTNYRGSWIRCVDYLSEGVFYNEIIPCGQGPVIYLYGYLILTLFGLRLFWPVMSALTVIMNTFLFYLIWKTIKIEVGKVGMFFPVLFYLTGIYFTSFSNIHALLSTIFFYFGFYFLFYSKHKLREPIVGLSFSLSILTLILAIIPVFIVLCYCKLKIKSLKFQLKKTNIKISIKYKTLYKAASFLALPGFILLIMFMSYPHFYSQVLHDASYKESHTIIETIKLMSKAGGGFLEQIVLYLFIIPSAYVFIKKKNVYSTNSFIGPLVTLFIIIKTSRWSTVPNYYFMHFYPMMIVTLMMYWNMVKNKMPARSLATTIFIVIIVFSYPLSRLDLIIRSDELVRLVEHPMYFIPLQEGRTLVEGDLIKLNVSNKDVIPLNYIVIEARLERWYGSTMREAYYEKRLKEGVYSLIVHGPPFWWTLDNIIRNVRRDLSKYYIVYVPNQMFRSHGGRQDTVLLFRDPEHSDYMKAAMIDYYNKSFNRICSLDRYTAEEVIPKVLSRNHILFDEKCVGGGDLTNDYSNKIKKLKETDLSFVLILFIVVSLLGKTITKGKKPLDGRN